MAEDFAQAAEGPLDLPMTRHPTWMLLRSLQLIRTRVLYARAMLAEASAEREAMRKMLAHDRPLQNHLGASVCGRLYALQIDMDDNLNDCDYALTKLNELVTEFDEVAHKEGKA